MIPGLAEGPGPGQRARDGYREDEDETKAAPAPPARVRDPREYLQQARDLTIFLFIGAGHRGIRGMRN
jgi:hypothetical protein